MTLVPWNVSQCAVGRLNAQVPDWMTCYVSPDKLLHDIEQSLVLPYINELLHMTSPFVPLLQITVPITFGTLPITPTMTIIPTILCALKGSSTNHDPWLHHK